MANRFALFCKRSLAKGMATIESQAKMMENHTTYSGCPENLSASDTGIAKMLDRIKKVNEDNNMEINAVEYTFSLSISF